MQEISNARKDLEKAWIARRMQLDQCLARQLFYRDCEQAENWMISHETLLQVNDSVDSKEDNVEAMTKDPEDFDKAICNQEEKSVPLQTYADHLSNLSNMLVLTSIRRKKMSRRDGRISRKL